MSRRSFAGRFGRFALGAAVLLAAGVGTWLPELLPTEPWAPAEEVAAGRELFEHEWTPNDPLAHGDGLGPVYNARSCAACHFQGGLGGGGGEEHNTQVFEISARRDDPEWHTGTIHKFSIMPALQESFDSLHTAFPYKHNYPPDPAWPYQVSFSAGGIQPPALFGAGWIDGISDRAIRRHRERREAIAQREAFDICKTVPVGRIREFGDGRVGKFGWKGQESSLDRFVAVACANELGLGSPDCLQVKPLVGTVADGPPDLDRRQIRALTAFVRTLPRPVEVIPTDPAERETAARGKTLFSEIGCAVCHVPDLGGVKGVFSDFLLYDLGGDYEEPTVQIPADFVFPQRPGVMPRPEEWRTPPLWGVADSAPYFHDGSAPTLEDAIMQHQRDAKTVFFAYGRLTPEDQQALIAFLKTLRAPPEALPLRDPSVTRLKP